MVTKKEYAKMVKRYSGKSPIVKDCIKAFFVGGTICAVGQGLRSFYFSLDLSDSLTATATSVTLIFVASMLTAMGIFDKIAKFAGAGTLVPITGFSNAVTSPAMEFKTEGFVTGSASKIFVVAGPVIVFGTISSMVAGALYIIFVR